jgi:hypothetical protein
MSLDAPVAVLQAAFNSIVGGLQAKQKDTATQQDFIASSKFEGAKPGFFFSLGSKGVGYVFTGPLSPRGPNAWNL